MRAERPRKWAGINPSPTIVFVGEGFIPAHVSEYAKGQIADSR